MKTCRKCKTEKDESEFAKDKSRMDGLDSRCKTCMRDYIKEYQKAYRQTDTYRNLQIAYRKKATSKENHREAQRAYRLRKKAASSSNTVLSGTN